MILGLSHLFGEAGDLDATTSFWTSRGWRLKLSIDLPVLAPKLQLLSSASAKHVALRYFVRADREGLPGIEFVQHSPRGSAPTASPRLTLRLPGVSGPTVRDHEGNTVIEDSSDGATVEMMSPDPSRTRDRLLSLGFKSCNGEGVTVSLVLPFLAQRGVTVALRPAPALDSQPRLDDGGWNGMSFLVRDLDAVASRVPLVAHQTFSVSEGDHREVAFYAGDGLLLEFLMIGRQTSRGRVSN